MKTNLRLMKDRKPINHTRRTIVMALFTGLAGMSFVGIGTADTVTDWN